MPPDLDGHPPLPTSDFGVDNDVAMSYSMHQHAPIDHHGCSIFPTEQHAFNDADLLMNSGLDLQPFGFGQNMSHAMSAPVSYAHHNASQYATAHYGTEQFDPAHYDTSHFANVPFLDVGHSQVQSTNGAVDPDHFESSLSGAYNGIRGPRATHKVADAQYQESSPRNQSASVQGVDVFSTPESAASSSTCITVPSSAEPTPPINNDLLTAPEIPSRSRSPLRQDSTSTTSSQDLKSKPKAQIRKRERNRVSAQKCRQRTKSKLSGLEEQAEQMASDHDDLLQQIKDLQYELIATQLECMEHVRCKCPAVKDAMSGPSRKVQQQQKPESSPRAQVHDADCQASKIREGC